jgi:hypothetical protein
MWPKNNISADACEDTSEISELLIDLNVQTRESVLTQLLRNAFPSNEQRFRPSRVYKHSVILVAHSLKASR